MKDSRHRQISGEARSWLRTGAVVGPVACLGRLGLILIVMNPAKAANFTVTNTMDSGPGSLREAILNANAIVGADSISCLDVSGTIALASPLPELTDDTTIFGPGADLLTVSGSGSNRVFQIAANASVAISGITVANGYATNGGGAGIFNAGNLTLKNCVVVSNQSVSVPGGGIFNRGDLIIISSVIASNSAAGAPWWWGNQFPIRDARGMGGGIYQDAGSTTISNCTIAANQAVGTCCLDGIVAIGGNGLGGAISVQLGAITIANSTISSNLAVGGQGGINFLNGYPGGSSFGGGIYSINGTARFVNCTVSGNQSEGGAGAGAQKYGGPGGDAYGGGIYASAETMALVNCTVYENVAVRGAGGSGSIPGSIGHAIGDGLYSPTGGVSLLNTILDSSFAAITSQGYNLFDSPNGLSGLVGSDLITPYFALGPLQDNGGPTLTHALPLDSPALDAGTSVGVPAIDQRGIVRPQSFRVDIGAFELVAGAPQVLMVSSNQDVTAGNDVILSVKAFGAQPLVLQWLHYGVGIAGATNATLPFTPARTNDAGFYTVVLSNAFGSVTSAPIVLVVQLPPPPRITGISRSPGGTVAIAFQAVVGRTYHLAYKHLLSEPAWTPIGADVVAASTTMTIYDTPGTIPQRFYRILRLN